MLRRVVYSVHRPAGVQPLAFLLEQGIVRFQDAVLDIVTAGPAHGEEGQAAIMRLNSDRFFMLVPVKPSSESVKGKPKK